MHKVHYGNNQRNSIEAIGVLNDEGLHTTARLCDGRHSSQTKPEPVFDRKLVTCKKCLRKLEVIK